jgi:hypothetical protein
MSLFYCRAVMLNVIMLSVVWNKTHDDKESYSKYLIFLITYGSFTPWQKSHEASGFLRTENNVLFFETTKIVQISK